MPCIWQMKDGYPLAIDPIKELCWRSSAIDFDEKLAFSDLICATCMFNCHVRLPKCNWSVRIPWQRTYTTVPFHSPKGSGRYFCDHLHIQRQG
jgi:hypothetical protein